MPVQPAEHDPNEDDATPCPGQVLPTAPCSTSTTSQEEGQPHTSSPVGLGPARPAGGESSRSTQSAQNMSSLKDAEGCHQTAEAAGSQAELYSPEAAGTAPGSSTAESSEMMKPAMKEAEDDWEDGSEVDALNDQAIAAVEAELLHHPELGDPQKLQEARNDDGIPDPRQQGSQAGISSTTNTSAESNARKTELPNPHSGVSPMQFAVDSAGSSLYKVKGSASLPPKYRLGTGNGMPLRARAGSSSSAGSSPQTSWPGTFFSFLATLFRCRETCRILLAWSQVDHCSPKGCFWSCVVTHAKNSSCI